MAILDDSTIGRRSERFLLVRPVGRRTITHVIHDVDGTHSLIRDWMPVMSAVLHYAMTCGLGDDFDSEANARMLIERVGAAAATVTRFGEAQGTTSPGTLGRRQVREPPQGAAPLEETDRFCVETAGVSALTQMEYGIRRAVELGNVPRGAGIVLTEGEQRVNAEITRRIWAGAERFDDVAEPPALTAFLRAQAPRLFRFYERVLNGTSRDRNLAAARAHPERWRVAGSLEFMRYFSQIGCRNYFITGAVLYEGGGMREEVDVLGFEVGPGRMVEAIEGSRWDRKMPKDEVMRSLCAALGVDARQVLVLGDGRSEIAAAVEMGSVAMSRLPLDAHRQRALHVSLGTNYIVTDFADPLLRQLMGKGD